MSLSCKGDYVNLCMLITTFTHNTWKKGTMDMVSDWKIGLHDDMNWRSFEMGIKAAFIWRKVGTGKEGHPPSRVNFTERLYEKKVYPFARANSARASWLSRLDGVDLPRRTKVFTWRKVSVKFWRDLVHFQITREGRRLSVLKRSFEVKLGILLRIRYYENIAGGFLFTCSFQSPKIPFFSIFLDTWNCGNFADKNLFLVHRNLQWKLHWRKALFLCYNI